MSSWAPGGHSGGWFVFWAVSPSQSSRSTRSEDSFSPCSSISQGLCGVTLATVRGSPRTAATNNAAGAVAL
ncbi:hypothetical protein [Streptomyces sp. CACIS-1.16CA]|uniref:hypothetical protein n=1 Tax=Streptomyces sp. CACIS-1.16CA TaxID=1175510 RepID=UPI0037DC3317